MFFFPHQGEALAKANKAEETSIFDISPGGGKTCLMTSDILNLINKGKVKRPLIIMPNGLLGQFAGEINFFTQGQVNVIVINTETVNSWGREDLEPLCENAPINTIFLSSYSFLANGPIQYEMGGMKFKEFPSLDWLKSVIKPDYVACDEAHLLKNPKSSRNQACMQLRDSEFRRIATGTLITNNPEDLPGQTAFLDPSIVGNKKQFGYRYGDAFNESTGKVLKWKKNAAELIRKDLKNNTYYLMYREKDWAASLPALELEYYLVEMNDNQQKVYKGLVEETIAEIMQDPELKLAWEQFQELGSDDSDFASAALLGKFAKLEQYLTAPDRSEFVKKALSEDDKRSCKIDKVDERIAESLKSGYKCIVAVHYKLSARHLLEHSKYKSQSVYYDAGQKDNMLKFINDKNVKVMFAVCNSLSEGYNLQMANRVIIADNDWTPGKLKQLMARLFRPNVKKDKKTGKMENLNKDKVVHIDYVLANNSADIAKFCYQTWKKIFNAQVMENCPVMLDVVPTLGEDALYGDFSKMQGAKFMDKDKDFQKWFNNEIEEARKNNKATPVMPIIAKPLKGSRMIDVPWVKGMPLPEVEGGIPLTEYMEDKDVNSETEEARKILKDILRGCLIKTQYGMGTITGVTKSKVNFKDNDDESYSESYDKVIIFPGKKKAKKVSKMELRKLEKKLEVEIKKQNKKIVKDLVKEKKLAKSTSTKEVGLKKVKKTVEDTLIEAYASIGLFNDYPMVILDVDDLDNVSLPGGWSRQKDYWYVKIKSKVAGEKLLAQLSKKYTIKKSILKHIEELLLQIGKDKKKKIKIPDGMKNFFKLAHTKASPGELKIYPWVVNSSLMLVVDKATHPKVNLSKYMFKLDDGYYYKIVKNVLALNATIQQVLNEDITIVNMKELKEDALDIGYKLKVK